MRQSDARMARRFAFFRKSPIGAFIRLNETVWKCLPSWAIRLGPIRVYATLMHAIARWRLNRISYFGTFFLRNRPQLELARRIAAQVSSGSGVRVAILACSIGAEVYSILWAIRSQRPDLKIKVTATDLSPDALAFAREGFYPLEGCEFTDERIFSRMTEKERAELFSAEPGGMRVRGWLKEGITWRVADVTDPALVHQLGQQDIVFANNVLCHLPPDHAERSLKNIARLVRTGGYLFVSGVDLDVRTKVARDLGLEPVTDLIEEIHNGDPALIRDWPFKYWGLEPFDRRKRNWSLRYSSVFRMPDHR